MGDIIIYTVLLYNPNNPNSARKRHFSSYRDYNLKKVKLGQDLGYSGYFDDIYNKKQYRIISL